jgi:uncharacterized 2Fe-2S/4Fe-4S cluster protein (DUF4445 family)
MVKYWNLLTNILSTLEKYVKEYYVDVNEIYLEIFHRVHVETHLLTKYHPTIGR